MMGLIPLITALLTGILIPVFGLWIKSYLAKKEAEKAAKEQEAKDELKAKDNDSGQSTKTTSINTSIDAQNEAKKNPFP